MKRTYTIIFVLLLAFILFTVGCTMKKPEKKSENILKAKVVFAMGKVYILRGDTPGKVEVKIDTQILPDDVIITGKNSSVNIVVAKRGVLKIQESSSVAFKELINIDDENNRSKLKVTLGKMVLSLQKLKKESAFEVETPTAVAGVRGTSFMVEVEREEKSAFPFFAKVTKDEKTTTKIAVLSGEVELANAANKEETITVSSLNEVSLKDDDFKNAKTESLTRSSLKDFTVLKEFSEVEEIGSADISEEIKNAQIKIDDSIKKELKTKTKVQTREENVKEKEEAVEKKIETEKEAIDKDKASEKPTEEKYIDKEENW
ncbi:MAG: FecR domain-containing protein [Spirochaetes bacterium]|nr:FecR domain-containing protein [Spirochaetota bacterium]